LLFSLYASSAAFDLRSFPTRRSSDLSLVCTAFAPDPLQRLPYPWPYPTPSYCCVIDGYNHEVVRPQLVRLREGTATVTIAEQKRSEEHTSELQSRGHLVCRLLLEKKN